MDVVKELNVKYVTNTFGEKTEVILPIGDFENLLEDLEDLALAAERKDEPTIEFEKLKDELKKDDLL